MSVVLAWPLLFVVVEGAWVVGLKGQTCSGACNGHADGGCSVISPTADDFAKLVNHLNINCVYQWEGEVSMNPTMEPSSGKCWWNSHGNYRCDTWNAKYRRMCCCGPTATCPYEDTSLVMLRLTTTSAKDLQWAEITAYDRSSHAVVQPLFFGFRNSTHPDHPEKKCFDGDWNTACRSDAADKTNSLTVHYPGGSDLGIGLIRRTDCCDSSGTDVKVELIEGSTVVYEDSTGSTSQSSYWFRIPEVTTTSTHTTTSRTTTTLTVTTTTRTTSTSTTTVTSSTSWTSSSTSTSSTSSTSSWTSTSSTSSTSSSSSTVSSTSSSSSSTSSTTTSSTSTSSSSSRSSSSTSTGTTTSSSSTSSSTSSRSSSSSSSTSSSSSSSGSSTSSSSSSSTWTTSSSSSTTMSSSSSTSSSSSSSKSSTSSSTTTGTSSSSTSSSSSTLTTSSTTSSSSSQTVSTSTSTTLTRTVTSSTRTVTHTTLTSTSLTKTVTHSTLTSTSLTSTITHTTLSLVEVPTTAGLFHENRAVTFTMTEGKAVATTSTTSTTSTTTLPSPEKAAEALFGAVEEASATLLAGLTESNETTVVAALPDGGKLAVSKLSEALASALSAASAGNFSEGQGKAVPSVKVEVPGIGMDVSLPVTIFAKHKVNEGLALVVTSFDASSANIKGLGTSPDQEEGGGRVEVAGAAMIDLRGLISGRDLNVENLEDPIVFTLPTNFTKGMKCAYWDEEQNAWSTQGVWASSDNTGGDKIECKTLHLSLFGALVEAIIETLVCANVLNVLNAEGFRELLQGTWTTSMGAALFGGILILLAVTFLAGAYVDHKRWNAYYWKDDFLLVYQEPDVNANLAPEGSRRRWVAVLCPCLGCMVWLKESDVLRQAVDDIASNWFEFFGEFRAAVETCAECMGDLPAMCAGLFTGSLVKVSHKVTARTMLTVSRRTAAAKLGMTVEVLSFVLDDEEIADFLVREHNRWPGDWRTHSDQAAAWTGLREEVSHHMVQHTMKQGSSRPQFLKTVLQLCLTQNPIGQLFVLDFFNTCKQRVLTFSAEMLGTLAVSCLFFEASGSAKGKLKLKVGEGPCGDGGDKDVVQSLGRSLVIAIGCLLVAALPVRLLTSLQTRGFKVMSSPPGSEAWQRQLRVWRLQDQLVMGLALLYIGLCILYIALFVANTGDDDHTDWTFTGALALGQDVLLLPFAMALFVPLLAQAFIQVHLRLSGIHRDSFVRTVCEMFHNSSNAMLPRERL